MTSGVFARWVALTTWIVIIVGWEVAAHIVPASQLHGSPIVPSWEFVFTTAFKGMSGDWTQPYWAPNPAYGGQQTYLGAFLAVGYHSLMTLYRLIIGLVTGIVAGVGSGLVISYWPLVRRLVWAPLNFLRMVPLLAAIPLFQFWLGANLIGTTAFIGFGIWVLLLVSTINAVGNVPDRYIENARTLGASRLRVYLTVVIPATLPELRTGLLLAAGLSWSLTVGAEYLGLPDGLGFIMASAETFTDTGRMIIVALLVAFYALLTFFILDRLLNYAVRWTPRGGVQSVTDRAAGLAAMAGTARTLSTESE